MKQPPERKFRLADEPDTIDTLSAAVIRLTGLLSATTPGPWTCDEDENSWQLHGVAFTAPAQPPFPQMPIGKQILKAAKHNTPYMEYWPSDADGQWITTMDPVVGAALRTWLSDVADEAREGHDKLQQMNYPMIEAALAYTFRNALLVARAVLGLPTASRLDP